MFPLCYDYKNKDDHMRYCIFELTDYLGTYLKIGDALKLNI